MSYDLRTWRAYCAWLDANKSRDALPAIAKAYDVTEWDIESMHKDECQ